jgi:hypothetical protein
MNERRLAGLASVLADEVHRRHGDHDREGEPEQDLVMSMLAIPLCIKRRQRSHDVDREVDRVVDPIAAQLDVHYEQMRTILIPIR